MSAKHTPVLSQPAPWKHVPWHIEEGPDSVRDANDDLICCVAGPDLARLIAEAGTVYHETGLTPRQLADQRDELLAALKPFADYGRTLQGQAVRDDSVMVELWDHKITVQDMRRAAKAIAKAEGQDGAE